MKEKSSNDYNKYFIQQVVDLEKILIKKENDLIINCQMLNVQMPPRLTNLYYLALSFLHDSISKKYLYVKIIEKENCLYADFYYEDGESIIDKMIAAGLLKRSEDFWKSHELNAKSNSLVQDGLFD